MIDLLFPDLPQNPPSEAQMFVVADAGVLFVKTTCYGMPFGVDLALESDGLIWRAKHSFARKPADESGELCWI